jgi:hypothetical protein
MAIEDSITVSDEYQPQKDEEYMSAVMIAYFRLKCVIHRGYYNSSVRLSRTIGL